MVTKRPNDEESNQDAQDGDSGKNNKRQKRSSSPPPPPEPNSASPTPDSDGHELYYCDLCNTCVSFTHKQSLVRHLSTQHFGEKLYKCPCGYKSGWSNTYQKHLMGDHNMTKEEAKDEVEALISRTKRKKGVSGISTSTLQGALNTALIGKENLLPQAEDLGTTPDFTQQEAIEHGISTDDASTSSSSSPIAMLNLNSSSSENESQPELKLEVSPLEIEVETEPQPNENNNVNGEDTGLISVLAGLLNTVTQEGELAQVENAVDASGTEMQVEEMKHEPENHVDGNEEENLGAVVAPDQNAIAASGNSDGEKLEGGVEVELNHAETDRNEEDTMDTVVALDQNAVVASSTSGGEKLEGGGEVELNHAETDRNEEDTMDTVVAPDQNAIAASATSDGEKLEGGVEVELNHAETDRNEEDTMDTVIVPDQEAMAASSTSGGEKRESGSEVELNHAETDRNEEDTMDTVVAPDQNAIAASSTSGGENLEGGGDVEIKSEAMDTSESSPTNDELNVCSSSQSVVQNEEPGDEAFIAQFPHSNMPCIIPNFNRGTGYYGGPGIFSSLSGGPLNALWDPNLNQNALGGLSHLKLHFLSQDGGNGMEMPMRGNTVEPVAPNSSAPWTVESAGFISTIAVCILIMVLELLWILLG